MFSTFYLTNQLKCEYNHQALVFYNWIADNFGNNYYSISLRCGSDITITQTISSTIRSTLVHTFHISCVQFASAQRISIHFATFTNLLVHHIGCDYTMEPFSFKVRSKYNHNSFNCEYRLNAILLITDCPFGWLRFCYWLVMFYPPITSAPFIKRERWTLCRCWRKYHASTRKKMDAVQNLCF